MLLLQSASVIHQFQGAVRPGPKKGQFLKSKGQNQKRLHHKRLANINEFDNSNQLGEVATHERSTCVENTYCLYY